MLSRIGNFEPGNIPYVSKIFATKDEAKNYASLLRAKKNANNYTYVIAESIEFMEIPIPVYNWKRFPSKNSGEIKG